MAKTKNRTHKRNEQLKGEVRKLRAEIKRLKKEPLDKDETEYDKDGNDINKKVIPCSFCTSGFMVEIDIVGKLYYRCSTCERTRKV